MVLLGLDLPGLGVSWESPEACDVGSTLPIHHHDLICLSLSYWQNFTKKPKHFLSLNFSPNFAKELSEKHNKLHLVDLSKIVLKPESSETQTPLVSTKEALTGTSWKQTHH